MSIIRTSKVLYKDKLAFWLTNISLLSILATWALFFVNLATAAPWVSFFVKLKEHDPLAVLHYNIYSGISTVGPWYWLYIIPVIVLIISILDFLLAVVLWTKARAMSYFLLVTILIINIFVFLFLYNILNYNL